MKHILPTVRAIGSKRIVLSVFCPQWRWAAIGGRGDGARDTAALALHVRLGNQDGGEGGDDG